MAIETQEYFSSDTPIHDEKGDAFQRYGFAKRIAETIVEKKTPESIVIGMYGEWGEGKTSVLNFIEGHLQKNENIVVCKFNPWRFSDESQLLIGFFNVLAAGLNKSITNNKEDIAKAIDEYLGGFIPDSFGIGKGAKDLAKKIATISIDERKKRVERILEEANKKIVIFIDDIDRLDKKEIQTVFKLIKLTGNFQYTSYILAFDEKMVARAIGEMYEDGGEQAGHNFLEKIIQVPLRLPAATREAIKNFCFSKVDNAINSNKIELSQEEAATFVNTFSLGLLPKITTPRIAVRYGNSLSFSLPLLYKEVNTVDLMLIEAVKVIYPELYGFIKNNPLYFTKSYSSGGELSWKTNEERKAQCKEKITQLVKKIDVGDNAVMSLLTMLFPVLNEVFNTYSYLGKNYKDLYVEKRIGSPYYFQRYFTYAVIKGEISDIVFDEFVAKLQHSTIEEGVDDFNSVLLSNDDTITKIDFNLNSFDLKTATKIAIIIVRLGNSFAFNENSFFGIDTPMGMAAMVVFNLTSKTVSVQDRLILTKKLILESESFLFGYQLLSRFRNSNEIVFTEDQFNEANNVLLEKALVEANYVPLFVKFPVQGLYLLKSWFNIKGKESLMTYLSALLQSRPELIFELIMSFTPRTQSSVQKEIFYGDLEAENYSLMSQILDVDYLAEIAIRLLGTDTNNEFLVRMENRQTNENRARQFLYWHQRKPTGIQD